MKAAIKPFVLGLVGLCGIINSVGCGGGNGSSGSTSHPSASTVTVSPASATVLLGNTQQFTANVNGMNSSAVIWSVSGIAGGNATVGTISPGGLYTGPADLPSPTSVTITAADQSSSGTGTASVQVSSDVTVAVGTNPPGQISVALDSSIQFLATISSSGHPDSSVQWSVNGIAGGNSTLGTISSSGLYTAPHILPSPFTISIRASSVADSAKSNSTSITLAGVLASVSQAINAAQGGKVVLPDGSSVTIPAGALPSDQTVTLQLMSALPQQPPSGLIAGVGPGLVLVFSSPFVPVAPLESPASPGAKQAPKSAINGNYEFTVNVSGGTVSGLQGSALMGDIVDMNGGHNFISLPGVINAAQKIANFSLPAALTGILGSGVSSLAVSLADLVPIATAPGATGPRVWNGSSFDTPSGSNVCPDVLQGGTPGKMVVFVHGMASSVENAFSCASKIQSAGGYGQVAGFDYNWTLDLNANGQALAQELDKLAQCPGVTQIDVEAHSEGVPVSLSAIGQTQIAKQKIKNFVALGGPGLGTAAATAATGAASAIQTILQNLAPDSLSTAQGASNLQALLNSPVFSELTPQNATLAAIRQKVNQQISSGALPMRTFAVGGVNPTFSPIVFSALSPLFPSFGFDGIVGIDSALERNPDGSPALQNLTQLPPFPLGHTQLECDDTVIKDVNTAEQSGPNATGNTYSGSFYGTIVDLGGGGCPSTSNLSGTLTLTLNRMANGSATVTGTLDVTQDGSLCDNFGGTFDVSGTLPNTTGTVTFTAGPASVTGTFSGSIFSGTWHFSANAGPDNGSGTFLLSVVPGS